MNEVIVIGGGVALGNVLAVIWVFCLMKIHRKELDGDIPGRLLYLGSAVPLIFIAASIYLAAG